MKVVVVSDSDSKLWTVRYMMMVMMMMMMMILVLIDWFMVLIR